MNKLLIFGDKKSDKLQFVQDLFGVEVARGEDEGVAGLVQKVQLKTKYFETEIDCWIDEPEDFDEWLDEFSSEAAREVRESISGVVLCVAELNKEQIQKQIRVLTEFKQLLREECFVVVAKMVPIKVLNDELIDDYSVELVDLTEDGVNEFKEVLGVKRVKQIIDSHEWQIIEKEDEQPDQDLQVDERPQDLQEADLEELLDKLKSAKLQASQLDANERHEFAINLINSLNI